MIGLNGPPDLVIFPYNFAFFSDLLAQHQIYSFNMKKHKYITWSAFKRNVMSIISTY
jgi:hypothetical protein